MRKRRNVFLKFTCVFIKNFVYIMAGQKLAPFKDIFYLKAQIILCFCLCLMINFAYIGRNRRGTNLIRFFNRIFRKVQLFINSCFLFYINVFIKFSNKIRKHRCLYIFKITSILFDFFSFLFPHYLKIFVSIRLLVFIYGNI